MHSRRSDPVHRRRRRTYLEGAEQRLVHAHHRPGVVELAAIVGRGEERDQVSLREELVPVFNDLCMRAPIQSPRTWSNPLQRDAAREALGGTADTRT